MKSDILKVKRKPGPAKQYSRYFQVRLTQADLDMLDKLRRDLTKSEWIRSTIRAAYKRMIRKSGD